MSNPVSTKNALIGASAATLSVVTVVWLSVPAVMTAMTGAVVGVVLAGFSWVTLSAWRNAQATENISHVLNRAEAPPRHPR